MTDAAAGRWIPGARTEPRTSRRPARPRGLARGIAALILATLAVISAPWSTATAADSAIEPADAPPPLVVYVRAGCPHCADAKEFLKRLKAERPGVEIRWRAVDEDPSARDELVEITRRAGEWPPGVPTFVLGDRIWIGFDDAGHSGAVIARWLDEVHGSVAATDASSAAPTSAPGGAEQRWLDRLAAQQIGLPLFTIALGLLDGFNPCAMWVLLFLLSMLARGWRTGGGWRSSPAPSSPPAGSCTSPSWRPG